MPQPKSIGLNERQVTLSSKTRRGVKGRLTPFKTLVVELRGEGPDNDEGESSEVEDFDKAAEWHDCSAFCSLDWSSLQEAHEDQKAAAVVDSMTLVSRKKNYKQLAASAIWVSEGSYA